MNYLLRRVLPVLDASEVVSIDLRPAPSKYFKRRSHILVEQSHERLVKDRKLVYVLFEDSSNLVTASK